MLGNAVPMYRDGRCVVPTESSYPSQQKLEARKMYMVIPNTVEHLGLGELNINIIDLYKYKKNKYIYNINYII